MRPNEIVADSRLPRHPLEEQALSQPEAVLRQLPPLLARARADGNWRELALLYLAQSNACRVIAEWPCQRAGTVGRRVPGLLVLELVAGQARPVGRVRGQG